MPVIIDNESTNGDIIKTLFPQFKIRMFPDLVIIFGEDYAFQHFYPIEWWNAKYEVKNSEDKG